MVAPTQVLLDAGSQKAKRAMPLRQLRERPRVHGRSRLMETVVLHLARRPRRRQFVDGAGGHTGKAGRDNQETHSTNRKAGGAFHGSQSQCRLDAFDAGQASDDVGVQSLQVLHVSKNDAQ